MTVITRFAPSPTGFLHIGGARTALFNWLFARHHGGQFHLRIEDTDTARSTKAATDAILEGLGWLRLTPDVPPVFQSSRADRHREVALQLVKAGKAYHCSVSIDELAERRARGEAAQARLKSEAATLSTEERDELTATVRKDLSPFRSPSRDGSKDISTDGSVIRLRAPDNGKVAFHDDVQGDVSIDADEIDDLILCRADGTPTYMLAVVVDDHDMGVTQVIRGDDHLTNTFRQLPIYDAMGWQPPAFAHIPLIHGPDGAKLSKRHGALGVEAYRDLGYLPEAVKNYLLRLGWSHGDDEIISEADAVSWFDLEVINKSPSRMDFEKLASVNGHYLRHGDQDRIAKLVVEQLQAKGPLAEAAAARVTRAMPQMSARGQTLIEIGDACAFLIQGRPIDIAPKAAKKLGQNERQTLVELAAALDGVADWSESSIETALADFCDAKELGMGKVGGPLRTALTGGLPAPDIALVCEWLGKNETLGRIADVTGAELQEG